MPTPLFEHYAPPRDGYAGTLIGRAWIPGEGGGPAVVRITEAGVFDISRHVATTSALFELDDPAGFVRALPAGERLGDTAALLANSDPMQRDAANPWLLAPIDLEYLLRVRRELPALGHARLREGLG